MEYIAIVFGVALMVITMIAFHSAHKNYDAATYIMGGVFGFIAIVLIATGMEIAWFGKSF